ncbi:MAG: helix-turn-helix domain-containing protein [Acidobacteriia bacterium]|nr:helix-turn-helix domain-containing protein [Terriglobia bacterium]
MSIKHWKVADLANELGLAPITIRTWLRRGVLEYVKLGRSVRIPNRSVNDLLRRGTVRRKKTDQTQKGSL